MPRETDIDTPTTVRLPSHYRQVLEEHRVALGAKSGPKALMVILDLPPEYLAKCVSQYLSPTSPAVEEGGH